MVFVTAALADSHLEDRRERISSFEEQAHSEVRRGRNEHKIRNRDNKISWLERPLAWIWWESRQICSVVSDLLCPNFPSQACLSIKKIYEDEGKVSEWPQIRKLVLNAVRITSNSISLLRLWIDLGGETMTKPRKNTWPGSPCSLRAEENILRFHGLETIGHLKIETVGHKDSYPLCHCRG